MGSGFAGQNGSERRRRRLAQESDSAEFVVADEDNSPAAPEAPIVCNMDSDNLLRRFVSPRLWKHVAVLLSILLILSTGLWWQHQHRKTSNETQLAAIHTALDGAIGVLLLLAAQLAIVTGWVRAQSSVDFQGHFRWWKWWGACLGLLSLALLTNGLSLMPELMASVIEIFTGPVQAARPALQIVAASAICVVVLGRILPDMSRCIWSQGLLVFGILTTVLRLMLTRNVALSTVHPTVTDVLEVTAAYSMFASMLLHCQFVAYINNAPPRAVSRDILEMKQPSPVTAKVESKAKIARKRSA